MTDEPKLSPAQRRLLLGLQHRRFAYISERRSLAVLLRHGLVAYTNGRQEQDSDYPPIVNVQVRLTPDGRQLAAELDT